MRVAMWDTLQRFSGFDQIRSKASIWATEAMCFNMKSLMSLGTYCVAMPSADVVCSGNRMPETAILR